MSVVHTCAMRAGTQRTEPFSSDRPEKCSGVAWQGARGMAAVGAGYRCRARLVRSDARHGILAQDGAAVHASALLHSVSVERLRGNARAEAHGRAEHEAHPEEILVDLQ